jgi:hypothetical protein
MLLFGSTREVTFKPLPAFYARPSLRYAAKGTHRAPVALRRLITKREQVGLLFLRQGDSRTPLCRSGD